jgi:hypothetical protein
MVFASNEETAAMRIHNIYADENGETHSRDIDIEMSQVLMALRRRDYPPLEFISERRQQIGFSIGTQRPDANTSSTWMRPTKLPLVMAKLASSTLAKSF